jgi:integrase
MAESTSRIQYQIVGGSHWIHATKGPEGPVDDVSTRAPAQGASHREPAQEMTVAEFVRRKFLPEHIATKRTPGRRHYQAILKHIISPDYVDRIFGVDGQRSRAKLKTNPNWPYVDNVRLLDVQPEHVQRLISVALETGYSTQTAKHIRNVVSSIISHAIREGFFMGGNPAILVPPPGMQRKTPHALTFEQTVRVMQAMRYPELEITLMVILTGMNIAEICGLQWKYVNVTDHRANREGELIPPRTIAVRKQWYRGELSSVPEGRRKNIPIADLLKKCFLRLSQAKGGGWNDFVLVSRTGKPINQINVAARRLKSIGEQLEIPWLSWQVFRRTRSRLVHEFGAQLQHELAMAIPARPDSARNLWWTSDTDRFPSRKSARAGTDGTRQKGDSRDNPE